MTVAIEQKQKTYFRCAECGRIRKHSTESVGNVCGRCTVKKKNPKLFALKYVPVHYFRKEKMKHDRYLLTEVEDYGQ